jgi:HEAT repeat protein
MSSMPRGRLPFPLVFGLLVLFAVHLGLSGDVFTILRWVAGGPWTVVLAVAGGWVVLAALVGWRSRGDSAALSRRVLLGSGALVAVYLGTGALLSRQPGARVRTLARCSSVTDVPTPLLRGALTDDAASVRYAAVLYLFDGKRPAAEVVPAVRPVLADPNEKPWVVWQCALGLMSFGPQAAPAVPELTGLLGRPEGEIVSVAAQALAAIGPPARAAVPALLARLRSPPTQFGLAVVEEDRLEWGGVECADPGWSPEREAELVRLEIATALWKIDPDGGGQEGAAFFVAALESPDDVVRDGARYRLNFLDAETRKRAVPALRRQLAEKSRAGEDHMAEALVLAQTLYQADPETADEVLPVLIAALRRDEGPYHPHADLALCVLNQMGSDAQPALPALRELRKRYPDDEALRGRVAGTIRWIDPEAPLD